MQFSYSKYSYDEWYSLSRRACGFAQTYATTKEIYSLIYTSAVIARLAPSALSIYFDHLTYLSFRLKKSWRIRELESSVSFVTGEESCREKSTRDKGEEEDEKFWGNDSETGAKFRHAPFSQRFSYSSRKRSFPRGSINNKDTSFYRIVRANQSQVADRDLFALLYYELITDKQRSTPCADITRRKKINACQSNPRLQGDERSFTEKKERCGKLLRTRNARLINPSSYSENQETRLVFYIEFFIFV